MGMSDDKRETMRKLLENTRKQLADDDKKDVANTAKQFDPILLPLLGKVMSQTIADDILSVQPMFSPFSKDEWPYQVDMLTNGKYTDSLNAHHWCRDTLNEDEWTARVQFFAFKTEEAYAWFKLRWS